jgi:hypothetical protein
MPQAKRSLRDTADDIKSAKRAFQVLCVAILEEIMSPQRIDASYRSLRARFTLADENVSVHGATLPAHRLQSTHFMLPQGVRRLPGAGRVRGVR